MKELEEIVQRMIDAGETEDNIKLVIEEYTANVEKTNGSQIEDATAEPESTASSLEVGSSEQPKVNKEDLLRQARFEFALPSQKAGMVVESMFDMVKSLVTDKQEREETATALKNQFVNVPKRLKDTFFKSIPAMFAAGYKSVAYGDLSDDEELDYLKTLNPSDSYEDPMDEPTGFKTNAERIQYLEKYKAGETSQAKKEQEIDGFIKDKFKEIEASKKLMKDTGEGIFAGVKQADASDFISGLFGANVQMIETVVPAMVTGGASLPFQIAAPMYVDYNTAKAKEIYGKDDPEAIDKLIDNNEDEFAVPVTLGIAASGLEYVGFKGITKYIMGSPGKGTAFAKLLLTGNREGLTELGQSGIEEANTAVAQGKSNEEVVKAMADGIFSEKGLESYLNGFIGSTGMSVAGKALNRAIRSDNASIAEVNSKIDKIAKLVYTKNQTKNKQVKDAIDLDIKEAEQDLKTYITEKRKIKNILNEDQKNSLINALNEKDKITSDISSLKQQVESGEITNKEFGYAFRALNNQDKRLSEQIELVNAEAKQTAIEQQKESLAPKAEELGGTIVSMTSQEISDAQGERIAALEAEIEENQKFIDDPNVNEETKNTAKENLKEFKNQLSNIQQAQTSYGFIAEKSDGSFELIINEDKPKFGTAAHEFLHLVLAKTLKGDSRLQSSLGDALTSFVNDKKGGVSSEFINRMTPYINLETGELESNFGEETITIMSESIMDGTLEFNDNFFTKIGDIVRQTTRRLGWTDVKFNTGRDVYNFIKDYNASIEKGYTSEAITKVAKEGAKGKLLKGKVVDGTKAQFSKVYQEVETMKADLVNPDTKQGTAFIIADTLSNEVDRRLPRIEGITAEERADIVRNFTLDDNRGLVGLLNNYNPDRNDSIMGYLNSSTPGGKLLDARLQEFYKDDPRFGQIFQTTTDEAVATKVERETAIEEEATGLSETGRKTKGKVIANELNIANKVKSEVAEANIDVDALTNFKSVPSAAPKTVGELLGINPIKLQRTVIDEETGEKIKNKKFKANLTAGEVASAQRWFNANRQLVIDGLPKGFDVGGQATGVPRTVLDALYTKKETRAKTAAGLKGQVKRANIKDSEFLALVDIIDGKPNRNRDTSARIIAIADLLSKVITNQEVRQTVPGTERIRSGMSEVMFSKADELIQVNPEFEGDLKNISKLLNTFIDEGIFKHNTVEQIDLFYEQVENVWAKNLPKDLITKTVLRPSNRILPNKGKDTITVDGVETTIDAYYTKKRDEFIAREDVKYGEAFSEEGADYKYGRTYGSMFGLTAKDISKANSNGTIARINKENLSMHKQLWQRVNESIKADPKNAKAWGNYFSLVGQDVTHPHRMGAEMIGWTTKPKGHKGRMYEWEHAMPATRAYLYLMEASLDENINFESAYDLVINNFKLIALDKADDMKLKAAGRQTSMGKGWTVFDNWYDRYFDKEVAKQGGIDPKGIQSLDGRTFDQVYNVNIEGAAAITLPIEGKANISQSISNVRPVLQYSKDSKGMSTFDFDETLIIDGENFVTATKDGDVVKIPSDKWPIDGPRYAEEGYDFDFSDFVNVRGGKEGPLLQKMKNQIKKYGPSNVFVLTARMQEAAEPIHKWLKSKGINIPLENITGLGKSEGDAKAQWFIDKYAEGYNDMYFVDDALPNVEAVKHVFDQLDVKGKSVQARIQFSKDMSSEFNKMLERTKGVAAEKRFSRVVGQKRGKNIGRYRFFVPPSAEDFAGLLYDFYGKGSQGNADMEFMKKALLDPFGRADREMSMARMSILDDYKMLRKELPNVKKKLGKIIDKNTGFTFDNAVRVYLFDKAGFEVPGISKRDLEYLRNVVRTDQDLKTFADTLSVISKRKEGYIEPGENWSVETIASDLENIVNKIGRKQYLAEFIENKNIIFSPENMNKIEAVYGSRFRNALEDSLYRMENGTNRSKDRNYGQSWTNWVNGSVGAIMFFNARSAVLQTLSTVNFINFQDNNIFAAGKALANQKQYWSDFSTLFNSDFLKARRAGLQINVNEAELANAVAGAQNKAKAALAYLLKKGFLPTQVADSFAIASGGSTFYRNRIKTYVKQGMDQKAAEEKAFLDFQEIAQETQQSSRPDRISQQQASPLGRLILAFANTPMQYNRLIKKAARDLINNRGDWRSNISRILYYGAIQNIIFSSLQQAIFALSFDDEEDDALDKRTMRVANGMMDTILRGSGVTGAAVATIKNTIMRFIEESEKGFRADYGQVAVEVTQVSPPMGSKMRKLYSALNAYKFNRDIMGSMDTFDYNNPIWDAAAKVTTATTNVPLDRLFRKTDNIKEALNQENTAMQRSFLALGWSSWDLQVGERVVVNKGKKNEYVKYLDTKRQAQEKAEEELKETKKKEKRAKQQRCTAIKSGGGRCKNMVNKPKTRCHFHD